MKVNYSGNSGVRIDRKIPATVIFWGKDGVWQGQLPYVSYDSLDEIKREIRRTRSGKYLVVVSQENGYYRKFRMSC